MATASTHSPSDSDGTRVSNRFECFVAPQGKNAKPRWQNYRLWNFSNFSIRGFFFFFFFGTRWRWIGSIRFRLISGRCGTMERKGFEIFFNSRGGGIWCFHDRKIQKIFYFLKIHHDLVGNVRSFVCITRLRAIICDETTLFSFPSPPLSTRFEDYP